MPEDTACQKRLFDKLADGEASSPATAAIHAAGHDWNSSGSKPSRALPAFFDRLIPPVSPGDHSSIQRSPFENHSRALLPQRAPCSSIVCATRWPDNARGVVFSRIDIAAAVPAACPMATQSPVTR